MESFMSSVRAIDLKVSTSTFGRVFRLDGSGHPKERKGSKFLTEIRAGLTTFFTMAYIIAVNASIIVDSGATCVCHNTTDDPQCRVDADYAACLIGINRDIITATAIIGGLGSMAFGFFTNLPVAIGPGMGMNAYFAYQVVGFHGSGSVKYRAALTAVFIEGFIFVILSLIGMRQWLVKIIPASIKTASGVGIGMFLTLVGMSYSAGIGLVTGSSPTPTEIAGCPPEYRDPFTGICHSHKMTNPAMWIGIMCGGVLTAYLMAYKFKAAILIGISVVSILSWPRNTPFTYFTHDPTGDSRFEFFKHIIYFHPIKNTLVAQDWNIASADRHFVLALFTFLYVDIIDASATLYSMARFSGVVDPETGDFPRSTLAYCTDAVMISIGSLFGCSPVTTVIESGAGITEGGRTGLTAITTGICFLISLFFAPIFASIPPWATGCTLMLVGCMMMRQVVSVNWSYIGDALPAFITMVTMPFTYSVSYGLIAGLFSYTALNGMLFITRKITGGRIEPPDADNAEYWTINPHAGSPPWFIRAGSKLKDHGVKAWPWKGDGIIEIESMSGSVTHGDQELKDVKDMIGTAPRSREVSYAGQAK
ncbi:xanthine/uracil permease family protein-like protein [Calycina marina]|uniref:Xanthine/uracil permease family protein-like protein n=1 Tax=Calycina marina TaxID=1763456 RepID=A0A9P7YZA7_9HELO|nr:xanthine/uracil permease family protein-like protein [Calycina marina]